MRAGLAWPNPGCPVMMVECERGGEERCSGGDVRVRPGAPANSTAVTAMSGSSYINRLEAVLAVRCGSCISTSCWFRGCCGVRSASSSQRLHCQPHAGLWGLLNAFSLSGVELPPCSPLYNPASTYLPVTGRPVSRQSSERSLRSVDGNLDPDLCNLNFTP